VTDQEKRLAGIVLGYGIPTNILCDGNYHRYFTAITDFPITDFILCGGSTNLSLPNMTEAEEMRSLLQTLLPRENFHIHLCNDGITSWDNLTSATKIVEQLRPDTIFIFCELTRAVKIRLLAKHFLKGYNYYVIGINFDRSKRTARKNLSQVVDFGLSALRIYVPQVRILKNWLQRRHIARVSKLN